MSDFTIKGVERRSAAFNQLRKIVAGMAQVARGEHVRRTVDRASAYLRGRVKSELARHVRTGLAVSRASVIGGRSTIHLTSQKYTFAGNFKPGAKGPPNRSKPAGHIKWSFFKGIPKTALVRIQKIFLEETGLALLGK